MESTQFDRDFQFRRTMHVIDHALTERQRTVIRAHYFEGKSCAEIARELQVHRSTVLRILQRAEARMQKYLQY